MTGNVQLMANGKEIPGPVLTVSQGRLAGQIAARPGTYPA